MKNLFFVISFSYFLLPLISIDIVRRIKVWMNPNLTSSAATKIDGTSATSASREAATNETNFVWRRWIIIYVDVAADCSCNVVLNRNPNLMINIGPS